MGSLITSRAVAYRDSSRGGVTVSTKLYEDGKIFIRATKIPSYPIPSRGPFLFENPHLNSLIHKERVVIQQYKKPY